MLNSRTLDVPPGAASGRRSHTVIDSPLGPLTLVRGQDGLAAIYFPEHRHGPDLTTFGIRDDTAFKDAATQLDEYFSGTRQLFDLPLIPAGNQFQQRVWMLLRLIPYGETRTYGQLATELGDPRLARAVGAANARNPLSIVVPCHRVVGTGGKLTGYAGGLSRKSSLLNLEARATRAGALF